MVALHLDYWHNQIKSHIFSPIFFAESVDFGIDNICVMCRFQIDFNSDLKSSFVKMSDLNLTIRFFPSQWRKTWILSSIKHEDYTFEDGESLKLLGRGFGFMIWKRLNSIQSWKKHFRLNLNEIRCQSDRRVWQCDSVPVCQSQARCCFQLIELLRMRSRVASGYKKKRTWNPS